ncbi:cytochrome c, class I [Deinococcus aerius]|uniref:Cytochrome c, class I n=1 Tax=Deinococcus aerius TaxID=200253 RepID=A0A2I9D8R0_9DEIO|nr:cytochrome c [Deinococcus aerius]GBF07226.1 cytochrome c, class I [Deinococcus aerius]
MSGDRSFTRGEITGALTFVVLAVAIGISSYRAGLNISGGTGGAGMTASAAPAPVNGQDLYASNCAGCHGAQAQGGVGPGLAETKAWADADFRQAVLHGQAPGGRTLSPVMPRFGDTGLGGEAPTEEQIDAIHAYVKGL